MAIFVTRFWTAELNYVRLAIAWAQFLVMVLMIVCTMRSYRTLRLPATKKRSHGLLPDGLLRWLCFRF